MFSIQEGVANSVIQDEIIAYIACVGLQIDRVDSTSGRQRYIQCINGSGPP
jgi:hypothetical protein